MGWYTREELLDLGLRHVGRNVRISTGATLYRPENISLGDNSRIDDQVLLTPGPDGHIDIGRHVYIGPACIIESPEVVSLGNFSTLAGRVTIYGATDDYLGSTLTNPTVPPRLRGLVNTSVRIGEHAIIGAHSVVLPGGGLGEGTAVGAMSLVNKLLEPFGVYVGTPARWVKERSREMLELAAQMDQD